MVNTTRRRTNSQFGRTTVHAAKVTSTPATDTRYIPNRLQHAQVVRHDSRGCCCSATRPQVLRFPTGETSWSHVRSLGSKSMAVVAFHLRVLHPDELPVRVAFTVVLD